MGGQRPDMGRARVGDAWVSAAILIIGDGMMGGSLYMEFGVSEDHSRNGTSALGHLGLSLASTLPTIWMGSSLE